MMDLKMIYITILECWDNLAKARFIQFLRTEYFIYLSLANPHSEKLSWLDPGILLQFPEPSLTQTIPYHFYMLIKDKYELNDFTWPRGKIRPYSE